MKMSKILLCASVAIALGWAPASPAGAASRSCVASSFADPADVKAYRDALADGASEREALAFGDNGVGYWGDDTTSEARPACALPPEDWKPKWGRAGARAKKIEVAYRRKRVVCELLDTMPRRAKIRNGACIDLNPGAAKALGVHPPFMLKGVVWKWADD